MGAETPNLATETVLGTPLQISQDGAETVVHIRNKNGRKVELKRFTDK